MPILRVLLLIMRNSWDMLLTTGYWLVMSFFIAGILHNILSPESLQRNLGEPKIGSLLKATISGVLLPICSCGVVPIGVSLYYSGACIGAVIAFLIATPVINPAAVLMSYAFLGPKITGFYVLAGLVIPIIAGLLANRICRVRLHHEASHAPAFTQETETVSVPIGKKLSSGIKWGILSLGKEISKYVIPGIVLASAILTVMPVTLIQKYLSNPQIISIFGVAVLGAVMYVCAVGHIPFIAALVAGGAAPGAALTFLLTGAATNLPEMVSLLKFIGKKAVATYVGTVLIMSFIFGYAANLILTPDFVPVFDVSVNNGIIQMANSLSFEPPDWFKTVSAVSVLWLFICNYSPKIFAFISGSRRKSVL